MGTMQLVNGKDWIYRGTHRFYNLYDIWRINSILYYIHYRLWNYKTKYIIKLGLGIWGLCSRSTGRNIWRAAQKPDLHAASYALRATSSLEVEFHFLLVATLGGLRRESEFGTCISNCIFISIYIYICFSICELIKRISIGGNTGGRWHEWEFGTRVNSHGLWDIEIQILNSGWPMIKILLFEIMLFKILLVKCLWLL